MYGYIYETTNIVNGKKYIGQKKSDIFLKEEYLGSGKHLKQAIAYYGRDKFKVRLVEICNSREELNEREIFWIADLRDRLPSKMIYNIAIGGGVIFSGESFSDEHKNNLSKSHLGKKVSKDTRLKISKSVKGRKLSKEWRNKISAGNKGKVISEKQKSRISKANKGKTPWNKGKSRIYSEETRRKMSEAKRGKSSWNKGMHASEESRIKNRQSHLGKKVSEETRRKMSEAQKRRFKNLEERLKMSIAMKSSR